MPSERERQQAKEEHVADASRKRHERAAARRASIVRRRTARTTARHENARAARAAGAAACPRRRRAGPLPLLVRRGSTRHCLLGLAQTRPRRRRVAFLRPCYFTASRVAHRTRTASKQCRNRPAPRTRLFRRRYEWIARTSATRYV